MESCPFLSGPRRRGPKAPKTTILPALGHQGEGATSSPSSLGTSICLLPRDPAPKPGSRGWGRIHLLPLPSCPCTALSSLRPPPSLLPGKLAPGGHPQNLEKFFSDKSRKPSGNALVTISGSGRELCLHLVKQAFVTCCWGIIDPTGYSEKVISLKFLPGLGLCFSVLQFYHQT